MLLVQIFAFVPIMALIHEEELADILALVVGPLSVWLHLLLSLIYQ